MWNLKHDTDELIYEKETLTHRQRTDLRLSGEEGVERDGLGLWD